MKIIGMTGKIGSGKSWLTMKLREVGYQVWDADEENRQLFKQKGFREKISRILEKYGSDKEFTRESLANLIFNDQDARHEVEKHIWPKLAKNWESWLDRQKLVDLSEKKVIFLVAPLLIEAGWRDKVDEVWMLTASTEQRRTRLRQSRNWTDQEIDRRFQAQIGDPAQVGWADRVFNNEKNDHVLWSEVQLILSQIE